MCVCLYVCVSTFSNISSETTAPMKPNFMWSLIGMGERKFVQTVQITLSRWPPYPSMVKTLKNLLLRNQKTDDLETWYAASGAKYYSNFVCSNDDPGLTSTYFTARSIWSLILLYGKMVKQWIFQKTM